MYVYIYIHMYMCVYIYIYIQISGIYWIMVRDITFFNQASWACPNTDGKKHQQFWGYDQCHKPPMTGNGFCGFIDLFLW